MARGVSRLASRDPAENVMRWWIALSELVRCGALAMPVLKTLGDEFSIYK